MIDEGTSMADLKGLLDQFAHAMFGADRATRFRPGYYPFTEPSRRVRHPVRHLQRREVPGLLAHGLDDDPRAPAWSTRSCCATAASTRSATRASRSAWASSGSPTCATPSATSALYMEDDLRFLGAFR